jgi:hypothetical protein
MDDTAAFLPIRADLVGVFGDFQVVSDRERRAGLFNHLFGFVERIDRKCDDIGIFLLELFDMGLEVGDLPNAIRSPYAAIENNDGIFAFETGRNIQSTAMGGWHVIVRKWIAGTELFSHGIDISSGLLRCV